MGGQPSQLTGKQEWDTLGPGQGFLPCQGWVPPSEVASASRQDRALMGGVGGTVPNQKGTPPLPEGSGGDTFQTLTPRELLQRLLECGEPLRSRDTCFRTSAATVLQGKEGGHWGQEKLGSRALRTWALGPKNSFYVRKIQAVERKKTGRRPREPRLREP